MRPPGTQPVIVENGMKKPLLSGAGERAAHRDVMAANDNSRPLKSIVKRAIGTALRILPPLVGVCVALYALNQ